MRAVAALFVLLHHVWLAAFAAHTFPVSDGPAVLAVLGYGHLAVAVFIVVSGFSLGLAPARYGRRLDGIGSFARRRAWRILPPYWSALVLSLVVVTFVLGPGRVTGQTWRTLLVHGLLLQDVVPSQAPRTVIRPCRPSPCCWLQECRWTAPVILEAVTSGRIWVHGSWQGVPRRAAGTGG
ncbi:MAG: acyltransferase family protein, partial [Mycobacterium leprae]